MGSKILYYLPQICQISEPRTDPPFPCLICQEPTIIFCPASVYQRVCPCSKGWWVCASGHHSQQCDIHQRQQSRDSNQSKYGIKCPCQMAIYTLEYQYQLDPNADPRSILSKSSL